MRYGLTEWMNRSTSLAAEAVWNLNLCKKVAWGLAIQDEVDIADVADIVDLSIKWWADRHPASAPREDVRGCPQTTCRSDVTSTLLRGNLYSEHARWDVAACGLWTAPEAAASASA